MITNKFLRIFFTLFFFTLQSYGQQLPPIVKFSPNNYNAGNQNWMISQDANQYVFFANNEGLLEFNGSNWNLYPSPNETIIRSVKVVKDKIFTGCYMEFGYWMRLKNKKLKYVSLSQKIKSKIEDDEQFWNILNYDHLIVFQSLSQIFIYDSNTNAINVIKSKNGITKSFLVDGSIYFQSTNDGLFEIVANKAKLISNDQIFKSNKIINIFSLENGLLLQTQFNGFYKWVSGKLDKYVTEIDPQLFSSSIYCSQQLSDKSIAIGTVSNGVFVINENGKNKFHITQNNGLSNNTALSLFEDVDKNLWIGLDNGINCINLNSPIKNYSDDTGYLGTVYASLLHNETIYVGTNQGLFCKNVNGENDFKFISGTKGQVWSLFEYDNVVFCGHDAGTFIVNNGNARLLFSNSGTWKFSTVKNHPNLLLQGNYYGISVLEKLNNQWVFRNKINGFDYSSKYFELLNSNQIFVSHEYKGVFRFTIDSDFKKASNLFAYKNPTKGKNASLVKFNNVIYYANKEGIFKLNSKNNEFSKDKQLSNVFINDDYTSGKLIVDKSNKLWLFSKNYIHYFKLSKLSNQLKENIIPIPASLTNSMSGYENISQISNLNYLIGTTDGYYIINLNDLSFKNYSVAITNVSVNKMDEKLQACNLNEEGDFKYDLNNILFNYTVPEYNKYINAEYQYILEGLQNEWSAWSGKSSINFKNLPPGSYTFKVRAKIANSNPVNVASYAFVINKPWYSNNLAVIIYFILGIISAIYIHKTYKKYYREKERKLIEENNLLLEIAALENDQQLMRLKNEQLSQDVDTKNKELAVSTMSLIKKNELLNLIKEDLKNTSAEEDKKLKTVISTINKNITEEDSWNVFKDAFNNADNNFLKNVKQAHPSLTPNDLRLCAYLRLNLSSKEIAPLLNISVRSVEIKRYRLRKKMDLPHEKGLVEYILSF